MQQLEERGVISSLFSVPNLFKTDEVKDVSFEIVTPDATQQVYDYLRAREL